MKILCGMDVHDKWIVVWIGYEKEQPEKMRYENSDLGREALIKHLLNMQRDLKAESVHAVYEASGLGYSLLDIMNESGIHCSMLAPSEIAYTATSRKKKTDSRDALDLYEILRGHILAGNRLPAVWVADMQLREDREIVRGLLDVSKKLATVKTQIQTLLKKHGIKRPENMESWSKAHVEWLRILPLARGIRIGLDSLLRQFDFLKNEKKNMISETCLLAEQERYKGRAEALMRIKGIGIQTAMVFLTEIGLMQRFSNRKEVGGYIGLVPGCFESGEADDRKGRITRSGPYRIRFILNQAYWIVLRYNENERIVYDRIVQRNPKHKKKAVVAGMRRLAIKMWHVARNVELSEELTLAA